MHWLTVRPDHDNNTEASDAHVVVVVGYLSLNAHEAALPLQLLTL